MKSVTSFALKNKHLLALALIYFFGIAVIAFDIITIIHGGGK